MNKKRIVIAGLIAALVVGIAAPLAHAASYTMDVMGVTTILGISVPAGGKYKLYVVDMEGATTTQHYTLPALSGNNGTIYTFKRHQGGDYAFVVHPAEGDDIDGYEEGTQELWHEGKAVTLIGDTTADTWWVVSSTP